MKKIILLIIILSMVSCQNKSTNEVNGTFVINNSNTSIIEEDSQYLESYNDVKNQVILEDLVEEPVADELDNVTYNTDKDELVNPEYVKLGSSGIYHSVYEAETAALNGDSYACEYLAKNDNWIRWTTIGAALGNPVCMYNLGELHEFGVEVETDIDLAINWYIKASELNYVESFYKLGYFYLHGIGFEPNYPLAYDYLYKGAGAGSSNAMIALAYMFEKGLGVEQNYNTATKWYQLANATNNKLNNLYFSQKSKIDIVDVDDIIYTSINNNFGKSDFDLHFINIAKEFCISNNYDGLVNQYKSDFGLKKDLVIVNGKYQDGYYLDIDGDSIKEVLSTAGNEIVVLKLIENEYVQISKFPVIPGSSSLIKYNNKPYFLTKNNSSYENTPLGITIYSFGENGISESCKITQQPTTDQLQNQKIFGDETLDYYMETILNSHENKSMISGTIYEDLDNNGNLEKIELNNLSANNFNGLFFEIYGLNTASNDVLEKFLKEIYNKNSKGFLDQIYIENINGLNYIFLLYENYNTYLYAYLLKDDVKLVNNYLCYNLYDMKVDITKY